MNTSDKLHDLLASIYRRVQADEDYSYQPYAVRIDIHGWRLLTNSRKAFADGSFDRYSHPEKFKWRGLERIMVHKPVGEPSIKEVDLEEEMRCEMLCIEARQTGEHGRRKYFDATPEELGALCE